MKVFLAYDSVDMVKPRFFDDEESAKNYINEEFRKFDDDHPSVDSIYEFDKACVEEMSVAEALNYILYKSKP